MTLKLPLHKEWTGRTVHFHPVRVQLKAALEDMIAEIPALT